MNTAAIARPAALAAGTGVHTTPSSASYKAQPHVIIIGGGFAGLGCARALAGKRVRITLFDRNNYHLFQPLLYQVASAALSPADIAYPIRSAVAKQKNCHVRMDEVLDIDRKRRRITSIHGTFQYDYLVIAVGAVNSYFGKEDRWARFAPGLKSIEEALRIRRRILLAYEEAERCADPARQARLLTFVVIGGGPTGVELAGAFAEISRYTMSGNFRNIDPGKATVHLIEAGEFLLANYAPDSQERAAEQLRDLGVILHLGGMVTDIDEDGVTFGAGERLLAHTVIWAAGVKAASLCSKLGVEQARDGRVSVNEQLCLPEDERVFVIGDCAAMRSDGTAVPGVAQGAMQAGKHVAAVIDADLRQSPRPIFVYKNKGNMATIGRNRAVAEIGRSHFGGAIAWMLWALIHIFFLIDFRSRIIVFISWIWNWLTFRRGARIITDTGSMPPQIDSKDGALTPNEVAAKDAATERAGAQADP